MSNYQPGLVAARLYKRTSAKGNEYFSGRLGGVSIALLKSRETTDEGGEIWELMFSEAPKSKSIATDKPARKTNGRATSHPDHQSPITTEMPADDGFTTDIPF